MALPSRLSLGIARRTLIWATAFWGVHLGVVLTVLFVLEPEGTTMLEQLMRWDANWYTSIMKYGYVVLRDVQGMGEIGLSNVGWFPALSMAAMPFHLCGLSAAVSLLLVNWASFWVALILFMATIERAFDWKTAVYSTVALLLYPTSFYFALGFPYSFYLLFAMIVFALAERRMYGWAAAPIFVLTLAYPTGAVICFAMTTILCLRWRQLEVHRRWKLIGCGAASVAALLGLGLWHYLAVGSAMAFVDYQGQGWRHEITNPFSAMWFTLCANPDQAMLCRQLGVLTSGLCLLLFYHRRVRAEWQVYMFVLLLFTPAMGNCVCYYRHVVIAWPVYLMIGLSLRGRFRRFLWPVYVGGAVWLSGWYLKEYSQGLLV